MPAWPRPFSNVASRWGRGEPTSPAFIADNSTPNPTTASAKGARARTPTENSTPAAKIGRPWPTCSPTSSLWARRATSRSMRGHTSDRIVCPSCWRRCARVCRAWACTTSSTALFSACAKQQGRIRAVQHERGGNPRRSGCAGVRALGPRCLHLGRGGSSGAATQGHRRGSAHRAPAIGHRRSSVRSRCRASALPPAFYELRARGAGRGVYSFCMCPGGWIVPAATELNGLVVNGMSLAKRNSPFANAALVVTVAASDFGPEAQRRSRRNRLPAPHRSGGVRARRRRLSCPGGTRSRFSGSPLARPLARVELPPWCRTRQLG